MTTVLLERFGSEFTIPWSDALFNTYNPSNPTSNNGGWNEMIASISDSTGHTTSVRARFVRVGVGTLQPLALTRMRDLTREAQGDCAAFGAFQCGGVYLTQAIPGFITRDKDRSIHLVYRSSSQRAPTILPVEMYVSRLQAAPESLQVRTQVGGVDVSGILRYAGTKGTVTGFAANNLWEDANDTRVVGAELPAPATGNAVIRVARAVLKGFYGGLGTREDTLSFDVVQLYLSDTTITRFGPGWALAEQSRLFFGQTLQGAPAAIWLSGDGSYVVFRKVSNVWISPAGVTAKLVDISTAPENNAHYVISLPTGNRIGILPSGYQAWAKDVLGNMTLYSYAGARLIQIIDPTGAKYLIQYNASGSAQGLVRDIYIKGVGQSDSTLVASLSYDGSQRLQKLKLWISATTADSTLFAYRGSAYGAYLDSIVDPRSTAAAPIVTRFTWDSLTGTPVSITRPPAKVGTGASALFRDHWRRAIPRPGYGRGTAPLERLVYPQQLRGTHVPFEGYPTDYTVDRFGGPTWVRLAVPEPPITFPPTPSGGDVVRHIERDSLGRVVKIVAARDSVAIADSVMYQYDGLSRVTRIIKNTAQYPVGANTLDSIAFVYDSVTVGTAVSSGGAWCSRLLRMQGVMGAADTTVTRYGTSGAAKCLPDRMIGLAADTTIFTYGSLTAGTPSATRPISVRDANGLVESVAYNSSNWNTATHTRNADNALTAMYYDKVGRPDSIVDPVGVKTRFLYDQAGRVTHQRTGTGYLAPVTHTIYLPGGLVSATRIYASPSETLSDSTGTVQWTRTWYDRLGQVDSTIGPGARSPVKVARKQTFQNYAFGQPTYSYSGNGTFLARTYDWQGRVRTLYQHAVDPTRSFDGEPFADAATSSTYQGLGLSMGKHLSAGYHHNLQYDNRGRLRQSTSWEVNLATFTTRRHIGYSRTGQVIADTFDFTDSIRVIRRYEYNRRGQRTLAADSVRRLPSMTILTEGTGLTRYFYNSGTSRLDSVVAQVGTVGSGTPIARARWVYDRGGRPTTRAVRLGNAGGWAAGEVTSTFTYGPGSRLTGLTTSNGTGLPAKTWYQFGGTTYQLNDELTYYTATEPTTSYKTYQYSYTTDGTRRLTYAGATISATASDTYLHDVFGNRVRQTFVPGESSGNPGSLKDEGTSECPVVDTLLYGADNRLLRRTRAGCNTSYTYLNDQAGNRLAQVDTLAGVGQPVQRFSFTSANELYFSLTPTGAVGTYDVNWHWYDAAGTKVLSQAQLANNWSPTLDPDAGSRTYYVYDGSDIAMTLLRGSGGSWSMRQRFLSVGVDQPLAVRATGASSPNLALISDFRGTTLAAVKVDGYQETQSAFYSRDAFGQFDQSTSGGSAVNSETGFTGASTPSPGGGFTYLRNRWYDPKTGRFLTQDPIGLAGGINLYAYAGNNPLAFSDPFGLCPPCREAGHATMVKALSNVAAQFAESEGEEESPDVYGDWKSNLAFAVGAALIAGMDGDASNDASQVQQLNSSARAFAGSSRAARREAMRQAGYPTSQQPSRQIRSGTNYRQFEYETPAPGGGRRKVYVTHHPANRYHTNPHWEAGPGKVPPRTDRFGLFRYGSDKAVVEYRQ